MNLDQQEFQRRGFLEFLHTATLKLKRNKYHFEENEINAHKNEFSHLYTMNGKEITNLSSITEDTKILVCCQDKNFKGVINSSHIVSFAEQKHSRNTNVKNHISHQANDWLKTQISKWTQSNAKLDIKNKLLDLTIYNNKD